MNPIKKSNSGHLFLGKFSFSDLSKPGNGSSVAYNKNQAKTNKLEYELEKYKDIVIKLQNELNEKEKEYNEVLKKNKKNKFNKTIKLIEEIIKICDKKKENTLEIEKNLENDEKSKIILDAGVSGNTDNKPKFKTIDIESTNNHSYNLYNKANLKKFNTTKNNFNSKKEKSLPKIKCPKIRLNINNNNSFRTIKKNSDVRYVTTLRNKINNLNDVIGKKDEEIVLLKKNEISSSYLKLQSEFLSNYNQLDQIKNKNILMVAKLDDIIEKYFVEKDKNDKLKTRLDEYKEQFNEYKNITQKRNADLSIQLKQYEDKKMECLLYHSQKSKTVKNNKSFYDSKITEAESLIERYMKEIKDLKSEVSNKNISINIIQKDLEKLEKDKKNMSNKLSENKNNITNLNDQKTVLDNKYKELHSKNLELKKNLKQKEINYISGIYKNNDILNLIKKKNDEIEELNKEKEKLRAMKAKSVIKEV